MDVQSSVHQSFRCGDRIKTIECVPGSNPWEPSFVFLQDVEDLFDVCIAHFACQGVSIALMRGEDLQRCIPERIPTRPTLIIDVIQAESSLTASDRSGRVSSVMETLGENLSQTLIDSGIVTTPIPTTPATPSATATTIETPSPPQLLFTPEKQGPHRVLSSPVPTLSNRSSTPQKEEPRNPQTIREDYSQPTGAPHGDTLELRRTVQEAENDRQEVKMVTEALRLYPSRLLRVALVIEKLELLLRKQLLVHESDRPRLFVVLPVQDQPWDWSDIFNNKFRVHMLCECGRKNSTAKEEIGRNQCIHIGDQKGFAIKQPAKLFGELGSYLLLILEALRLGIQVGDYCFGPPADTKLEYQIQQTISYLVAFGPIPTDHQNLRRHLDGVENINLSQIGSFLDMTDHENLLAGLYRIKAGDGGMIKWVCARHRPDSLELAKARQDLDDLIEPTEGIFDQQLGVVSMVLKSSNGAKTLFRKLEGMTEVYELKLTLEWNQTLPDLSHLRDAIFGSNVSILTINLNDRQGPFYEAEFRYSPILDIMRHPTVTVFHLDQAAGLWARDMDRLLDEIPPTEPYYFTNLTSLHFDMDLLMGPSCETNLGKFLGRTINVTTLTIDLVSEDFKVQQPPPETTTSGFFRLFPSAAIPTQSPLAYELDCAIRIFNAVGMARHLDHRQKLALTFCKKRLSTVWLRVTIPSFDRAARSGSRMAFKNFEDVIRQRGTEFDVAESVAWTAMRKGSQHHQMSSMQLPPQKQQQQQQSQYESPSFSSWNPSASKSRTRPSKRLFSNPSSMSSLDFE